jgi:hypothetical protein
MDSRYCPKLCCKGTLLFDLFLASSHNIFEQKSIGTIPILGYDSKVWQCIYVDRLAHREGAGATLKERATNLGIYSFSFQFSISIQFLFDFYSISFRFLFDFFSISIRFLFDFYSIRFLFDSIRFLFDFFSISIRFDFFSISLFYLPFLLSFEFRVSSF